MLRTGKTRDLQTWRLPSVHGSRFVIAETVKIKSFDELFRVLRNEKAG